MYPENPIYDSEVTFVRSVKNAALYTAGPANATFPIVHLYGNAYEMGYAQGLLQKKYLNGALLHLHSRFIVHAVSLFTCSEFVAKTWTYIIELVVEEMGPILSPEMQAFIIEHGMVGSSHFLKKKNFSLTSSLQCFAGTRSGLDR